MESPRGGFDDYTFVDFYVCCFHCPGLVWRLREQAEMGSVVERAVCLEFGAHAGLFVPEG